jgi:hypothetical protein
LTLPMLIDDLYLWSSLKRQVSAQSESGLKFASAHPVSGIIQKSQSSENQKDFLSINTNRHGDK